MHVLHVELTILIPQTTSERIRKIHSGGKFMRSGAKNWDLPLTLIIPGSGLIRKKFKEAGLTAILGSGF